MTRLASAYIICLQEDEQFDTPQPETKTKAKEAVDTKAKTTSRRALRFMKTMLGAGRKKTKKEGGEGEGRRQRSMSDADAFDSAFVSLVSYCFSSLIALIKDRSGAEDAAGLPFGCTFMLLSIG